MDLVNICVSAKGYYSGATYEENRTITKTRYEKFKAAIDDIVIYVDDLDGKYSECETKIEIQHFDVKDQTDETFKEKICDGEYLYCELKRIFSANNTDFNSEIQAVENYIDNKRQNMDKDLILCCRKCYHKLYVSDISLQKFKQLLDNACPECGENSYGNWILSGVGNFERDNRKARKTGCHN